MMDCGEKSAPSSMAHVISGRTLEKMARPERFNLSTLRFEFEIGGVHVVS